MGSAVPELVGLNLTDVYEDRIRVVGKGNKERIVYMGSSCRKAIDRYLEERNQIVLTDNKALFGSRDKKPYQRFCRPSAGQKASAGMRP